METILEVKNLKTFFYTRAGVVKAVDDVSFNLIKGETLGIVGESGSGKSVTTMSCLKLVPTPPARIGYGKALFNGNDLLTLPSKELKKIRGNKISVIFQDPMTSLNPFLKIDTQMTEVLKNHKKISDKDALAKAIEYLDLVGIPDAKNRIGSYPHEFSGGMRQRVIIATALLTEPEIIIADEPTTALDVTIQAQVLDILKDLKQKINTSIILISHDLGVIAGMCDHILVMYAGKVMEYAVAESIFTKPKHPYTIGLLNSVPRLDQKQKEDLEAIKGLPPDMVNLPQGCPFYPRCSHRIEMCEYNFPFKKEDPDDAGHFYYCWVDV